MLRGRAALPLRSWFPYHLLFPVPEMHLCSYLSAWLLLTDRVILIQIKGKKQGIELGLMEEGHKPCAINNQVRSYTRATANSNSYVNVSEEWNLESALSKKELITKAPHVIESNLSFLYICRRELR